MHFVKACFPLVISTEVELLDQMETQNLPLEELSNYFFNGCITYTPMRVSVSILLQ